MRKSPRIPGIIDAAFGAAATLAVGCTDPSLDGRPVTIDSADSAVVDSDSSVDTDSGEPMEGEHHVPGDERDAVFGEVISCLDAVDHFESPFMTAEFDEAAFNAGLDCEPDSVDCEPVLTDGDSLEDDDCPSGQLCIFAPFQYSSAEDQQVPDNFSVFDHMTGYYQFSGNTLPSGYADTTYRYLPEEPNRGSLRVSYALSREDLDDVVPPDGFNLFRAGVTVLNVEGHCVAVGGYAEFRLERTGGYKLSFND